MYALRTSEFCQRICLSYIMASRHVRYHTYTQLSGVPVRVHIQWNTLFSPEDRITRFPTSQQCLWRSTVAHAECGPIRKEGENICRTMHRTNKAKQWGWIKKNYYPPIDSPRSITHHHDYLATFFGSRQSTACLHNNVVETSDAESPECLCVSR